MSGGDMSSGGQGGREVIPVVPQAMSREGSISLHYPMLNKSNYSAWCIKMEVYMEAQGVWEAVESQEPVETRKDKMALAAIYQGISEETLLRLGAKKTAKEAWETLRTMHLGAGRVKEVRAQALRWELEGMKMRDNETIDDFTGKIITIVNHLRSLGEEVIESYVVKKILRAVSSKFLQIASTIEEFGDLSTKTIEDVIGSLKAHEERLKGHESREDEHVLLVRREWRNQKHGLNEVSVERPKRRSDGERNRFSDERRTYGDTERNNSSAERRTYDSGRRQPNDRNKQRFDISKIKCYACNEYGHFASNCRTENTRREEAHLVEDDVEEPALLMMEESEMPLSCESTEEPKQQDDFQTRDAEKSKSLSKANEILVDIRQSEDHVDCETEKLKALKSETSELSFLKMKLKEELDDLRAQKLELLAEAERMTMNSLPRKFGKNQGYLDRDYRNQRTCDLESDEIVERDDNQKGKEKKGKSSKSESDSGKSQSESDDLRSRKSKSKKSKSKRGKKSSGSSSKQSSKGKKTKSDTESDGSDPGTKAKVEETVQNSELDEEELKKVQREKLETQRHMFRAKREGKVFEKGKIRSSS